jgi:alpha-beta hydrolase superfamily lysophospholipase
VKRASAALALALATACGGKAPAPASTTREAPAADVASDSTPIDPDGEQPTTSEEVTFTAADGHTVPGTLTRPTSPGRHPALILMAGSGPTDRNWESPLLPGHNGSARLLAEALAKRGVVTLRFDKAGVGANKARLDGATFDIYRDEAQAALAFLRARADVAPSKLYVAGHSEGGMHAIRVAQAEGSNIAGLLLLSTTGRSMQDLIYAQLESQLRAALPAQADKELASITQAFADFLAGKPVDA